MVSVSLQAVSLPSVPQTRTRTSRQLREASAGSGQGTSTDASDSTRPVERPSISTS